MNNVEKQFDDLLSLADSIALNNEDDETLTDEQVDALSQMMDSAKDPMQDMPSNNGVIFNENTDPTNNVTETVMISANPVTGILNTIPYDSENITEESLDDLLNLENEDIRKIELGWEPFTDSVNSLYPGVPEEQLNQLFKLVNRYRTGEKFPYFNELPDFIKTEINNFANTGAAENQVNLNAIKQLKNELAKDLFENIITNNYTTKAFKDLSQFTTEEINKERDKLNIDVNEYNTKLRDEYEIGFIEKAEKLEASDEEGAAETAANLRKVSKMFTQSYTYEDMYNIYKEGKIKVKNIQVEKFNRTCQEFNRKYYNSTFQIKDIGMTVGVLDRVLDNKYNITSIKKFIVVFINYTKFFNPSNVDEHVFMYYFIQHILSLDINIPGSDEFNDTIKEKIHMFLDLIIEKEAIREEAKKNYKKGNK